MSEELIIRESSPTLAGIKTASLFAVIGEKDTDVIDDIRSLNKKLSPKGIRMIPVRTRDGRVLVYVYRSESLKHDFADGNRQKLLVSMGYDPSRPELCIAKLLQKIAGYGNFPHEVGLFLGYPPEDVKGFIDNHARNYKYSGLWKVYGNVDSAKKTFSRYSACTKSYYEQLKKGVSLERLAV